MKARKIKKIFIYLFLILFLSVFIYSIYNIIDWYIAGKKNEKIINDINDAIIEEEIEEEIVDEDTSLTVDFEILKEKNSEAVGFIKVNGTKIEYSVVKHKDNFYYLTHSFDRSYNKYGWIFANFENKFDGTDKNITLFGHNMRNGSMFGTLKNVLTEEWQSNEDNHKVLFITEEGKFIYQVFSTYKIYKEEYFATSNFKDDSEFLTFINKIKKRSNKDYNVEVTENDQILTLSTCHSNNNYRVVLHAKKMYEIE